MRVWLAARDEAQGEQAATTLAEAGRAVSFVQLDVTNPASVARAVAKVGADGGRLDVLINNAGVQNDRSPADIADVEKVIATYQTNVFGAIRATQALLPLLRASPAGRVVMMSSELGSLTAQSDPSSAYHHVSLLGYSSSKTALNGVTVAFAKALAGTSVKVNAADPGFTATDLNGGTGHRTPDQAAEVAVRLAILPSNGPTGGFGPDGPLPW